MKGSDFMSIGINLSGKTVIVTGAGSGIGYSIAKLLIKAGASVVVNDIKEYEDVEEGINKLGKNAIYVKEDISTKIGAENLMLKAAKVHGTIYSLINNAGVVGDWDKSFAVNVKGSYYCTEEAVKYMKNEGKIIFIGSASSENGGTGYPQYVTTKGGVNSLMRFFARELGKEGIRVNSISPAVIKTPMLQARYQNEKHMEEHYAKEMPIGRMGTSEDIANVAIFLVSNLSDYLHGQILFADGGRYHVG